jgi:uncharacterized protein
MEDCGMKLAPVGASGFIGSALLKVALDRGHNVTALERLVAKAGDVYDSDAVAALIRGHDAVISAFSPGRNDPNLYEDQVRRTRSIIAGIRKRVSGESSGCAGLVGSK